jgi:23S rRNA (guanosine2251-2'-O)-methyltransferase
MSDFIMGKKTVLEILRYKPHVILEIYVAKEKDNFIINEIERKNIPIRFISKKNISNLVKSDSHQGLVAKIKSRRYLKPKEFLKIKEKKARSLVVMLDSIFDPQNFGSILRSCECFSVDGVIFSKNRGVDITPTVTKTAVGASELLNLIKVSNLADCIDIFVNEGYFCMATSLEDKAKDIFSLSFLDKILLIMGSEEKGIQKILLKKADLLVRIPMSGKLQSLNVSNATAIMLSYIRFGAK